MVGKCSLELFLLVLIVLVLIKFILILLIFVFTLTINLLLSHFDIILPIILLTYLHFIIPTFNTTFQYSLFSF